MADEKIVIVGAGVIGCAIALALAKNGRAPLVIDGSAAAGYGSTSASAAIIRPYYSTLDGTALAYEGHQSWLSWCAEPAHREQGLRYDQCGCIMLKTEENQGLEATAALLTQAGVPFDHLNESELQARLPGVTLESFYPPRRIDDEDFGAPNGRRLLGGLLCPGGYINDPQLATRQIADRARDGGASFMFRHQLTEIKTHQGAIASIVINDETEMQADVLINVAGPHSAKINAMAGVDAESTIATHAMVQEVSQLPRPAGYGDTSAGYVITDPDAGIYMRPEGTDHILVGSLEPQCDPTRFIDPDGPAPEISDQWTNQAWRAALRFPSMAIPNQAQGYAAFYDVSDDWLPIYDGSNIEGFFIAAGTSGNQFKNALIVGEIMASLVVRRSRADETPKFKLPLTGQTIDLSTFSARRGINRQSSFSVLG